MQPTPTDHPVAPVASDPGGARRAARISELTRAHVFASWAAQAQIDPLPLAGGARRPVLGP